MNERHFLFQDTVSGEEFIVGANNLAAARQLSFHVSDAPNWRPRFICELSELEAEISRLDEYQGKFPLNS